MKKDDLVYLGHIVEQIAKIEKSTENISRKQFESNEELKDATIRRLEIIGEAVKNISAELKRNHKEIGWKVIMGMRDKITHAYFKIDWELVWKTIQEDIPQLKKQMLAIKKELEI